MALGEKKPKSDTSLISDLSCPQSNVMQIIEMKKKQFAFAESKRNGKGFTIMNV